MKISKGGKFMPKDNIPVVFRFQFLGLHDRVTIRTFNKQIYEMSSGLLVKNKRTKQQCRIEEIFYDIRTVRSKKGIVLAKRKNKSSELYEVS
jgi:hypothetical protein